MSKESIGYYILFLAIYSIALPVAKLGLDNLALLNFYKLSSDKFKDFLFRSTGLYLLWFVLVFIVVYFFSEKLGAKINLEPNLFLILLLIVFPYYFIAIRLNIYRAQQQATKYSIFTLALTFVKHVSALIFILFIDSKWEYILLGYGIAHFIFGIWAFFSLKAKYYSQTNFNWSQIKIILKESVPFLLHQINIWFGSAYSRVAISENLGVAKTGGFGIASTFQTAMSILQESFDKAYVPILFESLNSNDKKFNSKIVFYSYLYYGGLFLSGILLSLIGYYSIGILFGQEFEIYRNYVPLLVMASYFNGLYKIHVAYIFYQKKMIFVTLITFISSSTNVLLIFLFIDEYGLLAVGFALLLAQVTAYILAFFLGNKFYKMPWIK